MVSFTCEDLHAQGLTLISPAAAAFAVMTEDIRRRTQIQNPDGPPFPPEPIPNNLEFAAILHKYNEKAVAGLAIEWKFEDVRGHHYKSRFTSAFGRNLLLPFGARPAQLALYGYWHTILPGSKRLLADAKIFGNNIDVRPPRGEEVWRGGGVGSRSGSHASRAPNDFAGTRQSLACSYPGWTSGYRD